MEGYFFWGPKIAKPTFSKPALSIDEQLQKLVDRGLHVENLAETRLHLNTLNYYRLAAYWLGMESDHSTHQFSQDASFERAVDLYIFDREFRLLLLDAIERVEVAVRTQYAYQLGQKYGAHPHLRPSLFKSKWNYAANRLSLENDAQRSKENFIRHLLQHYAEPVPPIWATLEIMTLGQLSIWYANLKKSHDRNDIARYFDFDERQFVSFLHRLSTVRNLCAHHSRVWNRDFTFTFQLPRHRPKELAKAINSREPRRIYNTLSALVFLMDKICPGLQWKTRLKELMAKHTISEHDMGFPEDWQITALWNG
jgi:abortive infection bacteriophage resistance protein